MAEAGWEWLLLLLLLCMTLEDWWKSASAVGVCRSTELLLHLLLLLLGQHCWAWRALVSCWLTWIWRAESSCAEQHLEHDEMAEWMR